MTFLRANTDRMIKITIPGPFTMAQQAQNDFYKDEVDLAMDYATAVNEEIKDLFAAGADVVQVDEPYLQARPAKAKQYGVQVLNHALNAACSVAAADLDRNRTVPLRLRVLAELSTKTILLGVLDLADMTVEAPALVAERIRRALPYVDAKKIVVAPDCGLKYLPRDVAFQKMRAMVEGALVVRSELSLMRGG